MQYPFRNFNKLHYIYLVKPGKFPCISLKYSLTKAHDFFSYLHLDMDVITLVTPVTSNTNDLSNRVKKIEQN